MQALDGARQQNDNIKDEIWHELAQVQYLCWQHESDLALQKQELLHIRMQRLLQQQHQQELTQQVSATPTLCCMFVCSVCCSNSTNRK